MGTRADFYVGRGEAAEYLGSISCDGYPDGISEDLKRAETEEHFRKAVRKFLSSRSIGKVKKVKFMDLEVDVGPPNDATRPEDGWPWPWEDSRTTDYAYAFDNGKVWASCFGYAWFDPLEEEPEDDGNEKVAVFPKLGLDGKHSAPAGSARSGICLITLPENKK